jgi:hypothetical protein
MSKEVFSCPSNNIIACGGSGNRTQPRPPPCHRPWPQRRDPQPCQPRAPQVSICRENCVFANHYSSLPALVALPLTKGAIILCRWSLSASPTPGPTRAPSAAPTRIPTTAPTALAAVVSLVSNHYFRASSSIPVVNSHEALIFRGSTNFVLTGGSWTSPNATLRAAVGTA